MSAKAAMDTDSLAIRTGIQIHSRCPSSAKEVWSAPRSATPAVASAASAATVTAGLMTFMSARLTGRAGGRRDRAGRVGSGAAQ